MVQSTLTIQPEKQEVFLFSSLTDPNKMHRLSETSNVGSFKHN